MAKIRQKTETAKFFSKKDFDKLENSLKNLKSNAERIDFSDGEVRIYLDGNYLLLADYSAIDFVEGKTLEFWLAKEYSDTIIEQICRIDAQNNECNNYAYEMADIFGYLQKWIDEAEHDCRHWRDDLKINE